MPKRKVPGGGSAALPPPPPPPVLTTLPVPAPLLAHLELPTASGFLAAGTAAPSVALAVAYSGGGSASDLPVDFGTQVDERDRRVARPPTVSFEPPGAGGRFTLLLVDPDAPGPKDPSLRSVLHWAVTDMGGGGGASESAAADASSSGGGGGGRATTAAGGREAVSYKAPSPEWGNHRFVFLLFRQPAGAASSGGAPPLPAARPGFDVAAWAAQHGLSLVGVNFFCMHAPEFGGGGKRRR
jgi:phosphatidylethanolamine-binding protein (PEBP) family uncharacterized protein